VTHEIVDSHAHLDDEKFQGDLPAVYERAVQAGIWRIVTIATTADSSNSCVRLAAEWSAVRATVGIQPNHVAQANPSDWDKIEVLANKPKVVALGETGLDRHWHDTPFDLQEEYFARHLALARQLHLPVVIHCREAEADVVRMLREDFERNGPVRGVMHSFTGDWKTANSCLAVGLFISFAGMITFKNAQALREVALQIPRERLLVETDSPYLAPVPLRGQRNEPANIVHTLKCLADGHGIGADAMAHQTSQNAWALFALD
jgi:TatD DNase family protein